MNKFRKTDSCPELIKVSFDTLYEARSKDDISDYSKFINIEDAWELEIDEDWVQEGIAEGEPVRDLKQEFLDDIVTFTPEEALKEARRGHKWPLILGYVEHYKSALSKK